MRRFRVTLALVPVCLLCANARAADLSSPLVRTSGATLAAASKDADDVKMKALEAEVDVLKEKIFKSKARLLLLQETVLHGATAGAIAKVRFKNEMGGSYRLESMTWVLDGQTIFNEGTPKPALDAPPAPAGAPAVAYPGGIRCTLTRR